MFLGDEHAGGYGIRAAVNQLKFNPMRPYLLYASFRRLDTIYSWDVRGDVTKPVQTFTSQPGVVTGSPKVPSRNDTNQRLRFDIDIGGSWLAVGDHASS
jgi:telomerase Cajal body protein 1